MSSISEFKSIFKGGARSSLYRVTVTFPTVLGTDAEALNRTFNFYCKGAQIPGMSTGQVEAWFNGRSIKMAGDVQYEPISLNIVNDTDWIARTTFEKWLNLINKARTNTGATTLGEYSADMVVEQLGRDGTTLASYKFVDAWPSDIAAMEVGHDQVDQIEEFSVTMVYQWWEREAAKII